MTWIIHHKSRLPNNGSRESFKEHKYIKDVLTSPASYLITGTPTLVMCADKHILYLKHAEVLVVSLKFCDVSFIQAQVHAAPLLLFPYLANSYLAFMS